MAPACGRGAQAVSGPYQPGLLTPVTGWYPGWVQGLVWALASSKQETGRFGKGCWLDPRCKVQCLSIVWVTGEPGGCEWTLGVVQAEQVRPGILPWLGPRSCQAANNSELLPNTEAVGVRGSWQQILLQAPPPTSPPPLPLGPSLTPGPGVSFQALRSVSQGGGGRNRSQRLPACHSHPTEPCLSPSLHNQLYPSPPNPEHPLLVLEALP